MIPQSFVQELLNRVDIVEVVGRSVKLRKAGSNFVGLCPFHNEKSPSFSVSPTKQFYHCFGCGAHGTAVGFLMEYGGLSFPDAVTELAQSLGLAVPQEERRPLGADPAPTVQHQTGLREAMERAAQFYRSSLRGNERAIGYLKGRGLTGEIAKRFALGYAPAGWQNLSDAFERYDDPVLVEAGLIIEKPAEDGRPERHYDRFRDRIMFPIRNTRGQVIGLGGRILDVGEPKYLNSPETPLFQKGHELYGLFEARTAIREAGYVLVVEGYMDVVALAQLGFPQAVATLGTACTPFHVQKLVRQTDRIVFSFDGDAAGRRAARRALEASLPYAEDQRAFSFLFLPPEHDPDSFVREHGAQAFQEAVEEALPLSQFFLKEVAGDHDLATAEGRAHTVHAARPLLAALPPQALRGQIARELARLTDTPLNDLGIPGISAASAGPAGAQNGTAASRSAQPGRGPGPGMRPERPARRPARQGPVPVARQLARLFLSHPRLAHDLAAPERELIAAQKDPLLDELVAVCCTAPPGATLATVSEALVQGTLADQFEALIEAVMGEPDVEKDAAAVDLAAALARLRDQAIKAELEALAAAGGNDSERLARMRELLEEQQKRKTG